MWVVMSKERIQYICQVCGRKTKIDVPLGIKRKVFKNIRNNLPQLKEAVLGYKRKGTWTRLRIPVFVEGIIDSITYDYDLDKFICYNVTMRNLKGKIEPVCIRLPKDIRDCMK